MLNISGNTNISSHRNTSGNRNLGGSSMNLGRNTAVSANTPSRPALVAQATNSPASSSTISEFACLYTHDLRRKQKRWQDGRLKYHTYNQRVMVYDERGHFVGDMHWRADYDLVEGEELQLERGGVLVQVSECVGNQRQDLSELVDKRVLEREQRQAEAASRRNLALPVHPPLSVTRVQPSASNRSLVPRHPPLHTVIGPQTGHHGRAAVPKESPFEQRTQAKDAQDEQAGSRPAKRRRYDDSPPSKMGYAQSLFGTQLTLSSTPMSLPPARPSAPALTPERPSGQLSAPALPPARPSAPALPPERPSVQLSAPALPPARPFAPALLRSAATDDKIRLGIPPEDEPRTTLRIRPGRKRGLLIMAERRVTEGSTKIGGGDQKHRASRQLSSSSQPHSKPHSIDGGLDDDNDNDMNHGGMDHDENNHDKDDENHSENDDVNPFLSSPEQVPRQRPGDSASSRGRDQAPRQESPVLSPYGLVSPVSANPMSCMRQGPGRRQSVGSLSSVGSGLDDQEKLPPGPRETRALSISSISSMEDRPNSDELKGARRGRTAAKAAKQPQSPAGEEDEETDLASVSPVLLPRRMTRNRKQERRLTDVISESEDESIAQGSKGAVQAAEASVAKKPALRNRPQAPAVPRLAKLGRKSIRSREVIGFIPSSSPNLQPTLQSHTRTRTAAVDNLEKVEKVEELQGVDHVDTRQQEAQQLWTSQHAGATSSKQQNNRIDADVREAVEEPYRNMRQPRPGAVAAFPSAPQARQPSSPSGDIEQTAFSVSTIFPQRNSRVAQARPGNEKRYDSAQKGTSLLDASSAVPAQPQPPGPTRPLTGVPRQPVPEQSVLATATLHLSEESNPGHSLPSLPSLPSLSRNPPQSMAHHNLAALPTPTAQNAQSEVIADAAAEEKSSIAKPCLAAAAIADARPAVAASLITTGASATSTAATSEPADKPRPPRLANPATRGRKAALKSDAAGQAPQSILPSDQFFRPPAPRARSPPPRLARASDTNEAPRPRITMKFPGFQPAGGGVGPWSKEAHDLLETTRPG